MWSTQGLQRLGRFAFNIEPHTQQCFGQIYFLTEQEPELKSIRQYSY